MTTTNQVNKYFFYDVSIKMPPNPEKAPKVPQCWQDYKVYAISKIHIDTNLKFEDCTEYTITRRPTSILLDGMFDDDYIFNIYAKQDFMSVKRLVYCIKEIKKIDKINYGWDK